MEQSRNHLLASTGTAEDQNRQLRCLTAGRGKYLDLSKHGADLRGDADQEGWQQDTPPHTYFGATMTGFSLTGRGFIARFVQPIRVHVECYGPWCASLTSGAMYLTFLKVTDEGYLLETNPCSGFAFADSNALLFTF